MNKREFLRELAFSIKHGRIHKALRSILIALFFILSFIIATDTVKFYTFKMHITQFKASNWHISIGRDISFSADKLLYRDSNYDLSGRNLKLSLNIWQTIRHFKPYLDHVSADNVTLATNKKPSKQVPFIKSLPFIVKYANIQRFNFKNKFSFNSLYLSKKIFNLYGLKINNFKFKDLNGRLVDNTIDIPNVSAKSELYNLNGRLKLSTDIFFLLFNGHLKGHNYSFDLDLTKNGRNVTLKSYGHYTNFSGISFSAETFVDRNIYIKNASLNYKDSYCDFKGWLNREKINLKGNLNGSSFKHPKVALSNFKGNFSIKGELHSPRIKVRFSAKNVKTPYGDFPNSCICISKTTKNLNLKLKNKKISIAANIKSGYGKAEFSLNKFNLSNFRLVSGSKSKWIPNVLLSGKGKLSLKGLTLANVSARFNVDGFAFRGYKSRGVLLVSGMNKLLRYRLRLYSDSGNVTSDGSIKTSNLNAKLNFKLSDVEVSSLDFLREIGLRGRVNGNGILSGNLRNPNGLFKFKSSDFSFRKARIGYVSGRVSVKNFKLRFKASSNNIALNDLIVNLRPHILANLTLSMNDFSSSKLMVALRNLHIKIPVKLKGKISGKASILVPRNKHLVKVNADILNYGGSISMQGLNGDVSNVTGSLVYDRSLSFLFSGNVNNLNAKKLKLKRGKLSISLSKDKLRVNLFNSKISGLDSSSFNTLTHINVKSRAIIGKVSIRGEKGFNGILMNFNSMETINGFLDNFDLKLSGNGTIHGKYINTIPFKFNGNLNLPRLTGEIAVLGKDKHVTISLNGNTCSISGLIRRVILNSKYAKLDVRLATLNLHSDNLEVWNGNISIPAFAIYPHGFYNLYSVSGIYINIVNNHTYISGTKLSYVDGWLDVSNVGLKDRNILFQVNASLGLKGLTYLAPIKNSISYAKGSFDLDGNVTLDSNVHYNLAVNGSKIEVKLTYLLDKLKVNRLEMRLTDKGFKDLFLDASVGNGEILAKSYLGKVFISPADVPIGQLGYWKAAVTGNLFLKGKRLYGNLDVSRANMLKLPPSSSKFLTFPINLNVSLRFTDPITFKQKLWSLKIWPNLKLSNGLRLSGNFYVISGWIDYMGKRFTIDYGSGFVHNLQKQDIDLNLAASRSISNYMVYMQVKGKPNAMKLYLSSDPPLDRRQILNLVMTGASPEEMEQGSQYFPAAQIAYYATSSVFMPIEKKFSKSLNLENFSIEPYITKYGETVARFSVSKVLAKRFKLVGYETTGQKPEYGGSLKVLLKHYLNLEFRYNSYYGLEGGFGIEVNKK